MMFVYTQSLHFDIATSSVTLLYPSFDPSLHSFGSTPNPPPHDWTALVS